VTHLKAPYAELSDQVKEAAARWTNLVPAEHRRDTPKSAKSALETLEEHVRSCREHPLRALWVAHRHLQDQSPAVRMAALVLASEALWWLGHFHDAEIAAQAALDTDPDSDQARWRLAVALYREGRFDQVKRALDILVQSAPRFAPGWALRGQAEVWLAPDDPGAGRSDFATAATLEPDKWVVPQRIGRAAFRRAIDAEISRFDSEMGASANNPDVGVESLPAESVARGRDPDIRWEIADGPDAAAISPFAVLGGDFAIQKRANVVPGTRFILYQRNIENLCKDNEILSDEIRKSVAELYRVAVYTHEAVSYKGAPEHHAEAEDAPEGQDG
jgi:tetratricopeptide (TPR) repeat protein